MELGLNRTVITPGLGVDLSGFADPGRKVDGVYDDIYVTTMVLKQGAKKIAILAMDVLSIDEPLNKELKALIFQKFGLREDEILLNTSHTHSGPHTGKNISPVEGHEDEKYIAFFKQAVVSSVENALGVMEEVEVFFGRTDTEMGINRRKIVDGQCQWGANAEGPIDKSVEVLKFTKGSSTRAIVFNYGCHPSNIGSTHVTADFPGQARKFIEETFDEEVVSVFLQGCGGNIKAKILDENKDFRPGTLDDIRTFGKELGECVLNVCNGPMQKLDGELSTTLSEIRLPLEEIPTIEELERIKREGHPHKIVWAEVVLSNYGRYETELSYPIQKIDIGREFSIIAMNGEVCTEYSLAIKKMMAGRSVMVAGYSNGVVGYIPTEAMFEQGGYEPMDSFIYYLLPSPFRKDVEKILLCALENLAEGA
jgi:hypothetical protein